MISSVDAVHVSQRSPTFTRVTNVSLKLCLVFARVEAGSGCSKSGMESTLNKEESHEADPSLITELQLVELFP